MADIQPKWTQEQIVHRNGIRIISMFGDLKWGVNATTVNNVVFIISFK